MTERTPMLRAFRQSGALIALGLLVELATLIWTHPTAFLIFAMVGALLVACGIGRFAWALLTGQLAS